MFLEGRQHIYYKSRIDKQGIFNHLDSPPKTLTAKDHRPPYGTDGDYFSKPSVDQIVESVYQIMNESNPKKISFFIILILISINRSSINSFSLILLLLTPLLFRSSL